MRRRAAWVLQLLLLHGVAWAEPEPEARPEPDVAAAGDRPSRSLAREWFSTGVSLAQAGQYAAAKALFLAAYETEPHFIVLYNVAQAELQLGERAAAGAHLRRFLNEGGSAVDAEQRQAALAELARIDAEAQVATEHFPQGQPVVSAHAANATTAPTSNAQHPNPGIQGDSVLGQPPALGYALTGGGFAVLGGAVAMYMWNHERYQHWQRQRDRLRGEQEALLSLGMAPTGDLQLSARVKANNELLASVKRFDAVPLATGAVGAIALGAGLWALIAARGGSVRVAASSSEVQLNAHCTW